jgi:hypothetical protein
MSAQEIRRKAQRLDAANRRDINIGFMLVLVLTAFGLIGLLTLQKLEPTARIIIAIVLVLLWGGAWFNNRRKPRGLAVDAELTASLAFYRRELERRRDYFAKPPWILIVLVIFAFLQFLLVAKQFSPATKELLPYPIALTVCFVVFLPLWRRQARKFQRELDALKELEDGETPRS